MRTCIVDGCGHKQHSKGYCGKHYAQVHHHGHTLDKTIYNSNEYTIRGAICEIRLCDSRCNLKGSALIDAEDLGKIKDHKWYLSGDRVKNGRSGLYLYHLILGFESKGAIGIDHVNGNPLDNRKANLRIATQQENCCNKKKVLSNKSGFVGVCWDKRANRWRAYIVTNYRQKHIGFFDSPEEAAKARDKAALELHGRFAALNFKRRHKILLPKYQQPEEGGNGDAQTNEE